MQQSPRALSRFHESLFGPTGIHGRWRAGLDATFAHAFGMALGGWVRARGESAILMGRDARLSGVTLCAALQAGLRVTGVDVFDTGAIHVPAVHFGAYMLGIGTVVYVGAGHVPAEFNGIEIIHDGQELGPDVLDELRQRMQRPTAGGVAPGRYRVAHLQATYAERLRCDIAPLPPMRIAIDGGNGIAGAAAPGLMRALGCDVIPLFCDPEDGFPNHPPDPTDPRNLQDLIYCLRYSDCQLGIALDADGRRMAAVTRTGRIIGPDQQTVLFAQDILASRPGATVIHGANADRRVPTAIAAAGGVPVASLPGGGSVQGQLLATGALLAVDLAGHVRFTDRWLGFADGLYAAARLLERVAGEADPADVLDTLPQALPLPMGRRVSRTATLPYA